MQYKVTERVLRLVDQLFLEGYEGEATYTNSYCSGTEGILEKSLSICLTGFCKENLYLTENTDSSNIVAIGRYNMEFDKAEMQVEDIVEIAWDMYKVYGYSMPEDFRNLFEKYGKIHKVKVTKYEETCK